MEVVNGVGHGVVRGKSEEVTQTLSRAYQCTATKKGECQVGEVDFLMYK